MKLTEDSSNYIGKEALGFLVNCEVSDETKNQVQKLQKDLISKFGDSIWCQPLVTLHVTLLDWLAPLVDYKKDKQKLFNEIFNEYDQNMNDLLRNVGPISINFNQVKVSPNAVFAVGDDSGTFNEIRQHFLKNTRLIDGTKQPPSIVHFSIARFVSELSISEVESLLNDFQIDTQTTVTNFRLIKETVLPMQKFEIIKNYSLVK